jgi:hypothetical protein
MLVRGRTRTSSVFRPVVVRLSRLVALPIQDAVMPLPYKDVGAAYATH